MQCVERARVLWGKGGGKGLLEGQLAILHKVPGPGPVGQVIFEQRGRSRGREFQAEETSRAKVLRCQDTWRFQGIKKAGAAGPEFEGWAWLGSNTALFPNTGSWHGS